jgi:hypothetical protein
VSRFKSEEGNEFMKIKLPGIIKKYVDSVKSILACCADAANARDENGTVSRNHKPFWAAKLNQIQCEGELNNAFGLAFAPSAVNSGHEISEGQRPSRGIGFHLQDLVNFHNMIIASGAKWAAKPDSKGLLQNG